ncbi:hypothetical protein QQ045_031836 [Rhodiola kirilowii]
MNGYYTWISHSEESNDPPTCILWQQWLAEERQGASSSTIGGHRQANSTIDILRDAFPFHQMHHDQNQMNMDTNDDDLGSGMAYERDNNLIGEAQTPLYNSCDGTILETILKAMQLKIKSRMSDKSFNKYLHVTNAILPRDNNYPSFYKDVKRLLKNMELGASKLSHNTWPIVLMPYNFPPQMCMKKEMNILCMLISGPKSPGKCLNVFMRPLIDELKMLWEEGVQTYDRTDGSSFLMKAVVMWTISDFPGLGMLDGIKTKGYKACPLCLDDIDATHLTGRMSYQGHQRWLPRDHEWRFASNRFNGKIEHREPPTSLSEKNVFDNIIGTILGLEGKTKDDIKDRKGLEEQRVWRKLWYKPSGSTSRNEKVTKAPYTVTLNEKVEVLELIKDAKYPSGYAGNLRNKINLDNKKFIGLKTHDCHVM